MEAIVWLIRREVLCPLAAGGPFGNAQAIIRCGEPVQLQLSKGVLHVIAPEGLSLARAMGVAQ
jgi:hypothetical protein